VYSRVFRVWTVFFREEVMVKSSRSVYPEIAGACLGSYLGRGGFAGC
jgi:hypothetical protein